MIDQPKDDSVLSEENEDRHLEEIMKDDTIPGHPDQPLEARKKRYRMRTYVRGTYDLQVVRMQISNRIVANFKSRIGQIPGASEATLGKQAQILLRALRKDYKLISEGYKDVRKIGLANFKGTALIADFTEHSLIGLYSTLLAEEENHFKLMGKALKEYQLFTDFLEPIKGIGPALSAVLISEIDIYKCDTVSSLWKYSGLDTGPDGLGRSKRKEHLVQRPYHSVKLGKTTLRASVTYNPFLKTKLMGVLASCFMKTKDNPYLPVYYATKTKMENHAKWGTHRDGVKDDGLPRTSPMRRHKQAMRAMVKIFLQDLYAAWRKIEGLNVRPPYSEEKLGRGHKGVAFTDAPPMNLGEIDEASKCPACGAKFDKALEMDFRGPETCPLYKCGTVFSRRKLSVAFQGEKCKKKLVKAEKPG